jgi:predicted phage tail protein
MNIRDLDDSKEIRMTEREVDRLKGRVTQLEIQNKNLVTERIDTLHSTVRNFRKALAHIWKEVERITGQQIRMPEDVSKAPAEESAPLTEIKEMVADAQREIARKDGERRDEMR